MTKRSNHEGTYKHRADGRHVYQVRWEGERHEFYGKTKTDARNKMREGVKRLEAGMPAKDASVTFGAWLTQWLCDGLDGRSTRRGPLKETTKQNYRTLAEVHIVGRTDADHPERDIIADPITRVKLAKLRPSHVESLIVRLRAKGLAESSVRTAYHIVHVSLDAAVRDELLAVNHASKVERPVAEVTEANHYSPADVMRFLAAAEQYRYHEVLHLVAATGLRRGEALALKWDNVDLVDGAMEIVATLSRVGKRLETKLITTDVKTRNSRRRIALSPATVDMLARLKDQQDREREFAGSIWTETGYVFTTETGQPVDGRNVFRALQWAAKKTGLVGINVHSLRHSWSSAAAMSGEPMAAVSKQLGHHDLEITSRYVHTNATAERETALRSAGLFGL